MVYETPQLLDEENSAIERIDALRSQLSHQVSVPRRWLGSLRRQQYARAVQGSNSIEGYDALLDDVMAAIDDDKPLDAEAETVAALQGYRDAMTYVLQLAEEPDLEVDETLVKALHFMMLKYDLSKSPGRWRPGPIWVERESDQKTVYEGPPAEEVPAIMEEMLDRLDEDTSPPLVRASMAHLNLVMVHPFRDGNGRMARCLQTLVLTGDRILAPAFSSIEEWLGRNTQAYYDILGQVGQGEWHPERSARPWVQFCLTAHYYQALTLLRRVDESERLWDACWDLTRRHALPERLIAGLFDSARGLRVRNSTYRAAVSQSFAEDVSEQVASRDLRLAVQAGLLGPKGETRGRWYVTTVDLRKVWLDIVATRSPFHPDELFAASQPSSSLG